MPMVVRMIWMIAGRVIVIMIVMRMIVMMVMRVVLAMTVLAARPMIVGVVMAVVMRLGGGALALHVSPAFGIERRLERNHPSPETLGHRLDDGIPADAQRPRQHFGQKMPVAKMPGDAGHRQCVSGPDLRQRFRLGEHLDHASVFEPQPIAAAQHRRFREIE